MLVAPATVRVIDTGGFLAPGIQPPSEAAERRLQRPRRFTAKVYITARLPAWKGRFRAAAYNGCRGHPQKALGRVT